MSSSVLLDHAGVRVLIARFIGWPRLKRKEPRLPLDVEQVITTAYHRIDEQDARLKLREMQLRLRDVEIELLQTDLEWTAAVIKKANIVLSTDDYIRLQQVLIKVRAMRTIQLH